MDCYNFEFYLAVGITAVSFLALGIYLGYRLGDKHGFNAGRKAGEESTKMRYLGSWSDPSK